MRSKSTLLQSALFDLKNSLLENGFINFNDNDVLTKQKDNPSESTLTVPKKVLPYLGFHSDSITSPRLSSSRSFAREATPLLSPWPELSLPPRKFQSTIALSFSTLRRQGVWGG